jgi:hypothetical protein
VADELGAFRLVNVRWAKYGLEVTISGETALPVGRVEVRAGVDQRLEEITNRRSHGRCTRD